MHDASSSLRDGWILPVLERLIGPPALHELRASSGPSIWVSAVRQGLVADAELLRAAATQLALPVWDGAPLPLHARDLVTEQWARRFHVVPVALSATTLTIATATPLDLDCERTLGFATGRSVQTRLASPLAIAQALDDLYSAEPTDATAQSIHRDSHATAAPDGAIVALVDSLIAAGIAARASDIHLEPEQAGIAVRHRVDGVLRQAALLEAERGLPLVSRIKILAGLDIADRLRPQDGRLTVRLGAGEVDLRVSTLPAARGEKVVLRVLDARAGAARLDTLGLAVPALRRLQGALDAREGLVLVTGPTGSGKTTTLYAALRAIQLRGVNVVTVEDPVEYRLPGVAQVQVSARTGLTFAAALRSILRQDPDVILVGEIRDPETAAIAVQAALTGHLVLSTLHTLDAASAIARLDDLGVDRYKIAASLRGVVAQRLLRRLCNGCRRPDDEPPGPAMARWIPSGALLHRERGCPACAESGFRGRIAITETLLVDQVVERAIAAGATTDAIADAAAAGGMERLWAAGVGQVLAGHTSVAELQRVVDVPFPPAVQALARETTEALGVGPRLRSTGHGTGTGTPHEPRSDPVAEALASLARFELIEPPRP